MNRPATKQSPPAVTADVKTSGEARKMRSLVNSYVDLALPRWLHADIALQSDARGRCSRRLYTAHPGYRAYVEFHARRAATL